MEASQPIPESGTTPPSPSPAAAEEETAAPAEQPEIKDDGGDGEGAEDEALFLKAQTLMETLTSSQDNPNPKVLHALASMMETEESRYMKETGHASSSNARSSHSIGRLANLVRENDDFFELISSKYLSDSRCSLPVQAAASRLLLSCSPTWMYPQVFEESVLDNLKNWVMDNNAGFSGDKGHSDCEWGTNKASDFEMRRTYSTGLLAVCLAGGGQLVEDVLTAGLSAKLMHYLRIRILGEIGGNNIHGKSRDEGHSWMPQRVETVNLEQSRMVEDGTSVDQVSEEEDLLNRGMHDSLANGFGNDNDNVDVGSRLLTEDAGDVKVRVLDRSVPSKSIHDGNFYSSARGDSSRRRIGHGLSRSREKNRASEDAMETEPHLNSPASGGGKSIQACTGGERGLIRNLDAKAMADTGRSSSRSSIEAFELEMDNDDRFQECKVGSKDITEMVKSAVRAAEAEARTANAPAEAVKAAGDAAAELVKSAALDELKTTNDEKAAILAASKAASTVIDAANSFEVSRYAKTNDADASKSDGTKTESVEDILDFTIPGIDFLAQQRERYCIQCLVLLGEYVEVLGPVLHEKGVDVCLALLIRYSKHKEETEAAVVLPEVLKLICALAAHKKFAALFVDRSGMQKLLAVSRGAHTFCGLSSCLFTIGSLQGVMERVCTLPPCTVSQLVELGLQLLDCSQDHARKNAALFFASAFVFRAILDAFDAQDGLQKLLILLQDAASVRSGVNSGTLASSNPGSLRNDRSNAEVLTSSEKQIAYHTCVALRQYFRAQLLLLVDSLRPNKSSRSAARSMPSVRAPYKPLDISNEAIDTVFSQIQKDRKLGPGLVKAKWSAVDKFLACNGHITMLELCQAPRVERYLHDLLQYALGVLHIVTLVPHSRKLLVTATLSNTRVGIAVVLDAASGPGYNDPEIIQQALNVMVNLVCPPPSISMKPPLHAQSLQSTSNGANMESRDRITEQSAPDRTISSTPSQSEPRERNGEASNADRAPPQTPTSTIASGLVGDRRISLGAGAGGAGLAAQLEQGYRQARDAVRSNSGIKVLLQLIQTRIAMPPAMLDCVRALACRVLLGLARDETIAHILTKLQVGKKLSELIRDLGSQTPGTEQSRWQAELAQVAVELIAIVTNSGRASTLAATDAATPTLRRIERAAIAQATPISYHSRELLMLIHEHLQACGLGTTASALLKEAHLAPLPSLVAPSSLPYHISAQETPSVLQIQWPSGRCSGGFLSNKLRSLGRSKSCLSAASVKKKPLIFSSSTCVSKIQNVSGHLQSGSSVGKLPSVSLVKAFDPASELDNPTTFLAKSTLEAETQNKTPIVLPMKRKLTELKEIGSASGKRHNTGDHGLRSPSFHTPNPRKSSFFSDPVAFLTPISSPIDFSLRPNTAFMGHSSNLAVADAQQNDCNPSNSSNLGLTGDIQLGNSDRLTLDSIVIQYLKHQHRQCPAPITTLPALSLLQPHVCPDPRHSLDAPSNVSARLSSREFRSMYGGIHGNRRDRQFVFSRFRPFRTCRDDASALMTSMAFLGNLQIAAGFDSGEVKVFDIYTNQVIESSFGRQVAQLPVSLLQSYIGDDGAQLLLSSSSSDVRLWDLSTGSLLSAGPVHCFDECKNARFGNLGSVFAALPLETSRREIMLYDLRTHQLEQRLSDSSSASSSGRGHAYSLVHFDPLDTMVLWNGVLWDRRVPGPLHRFDQFTDYGGGGFHPAGNEVIINSEVWDLRKFRLLRTVPSLDQTTITFNSRGDVIYAILRRNLDDVMAAVLTRRAKHPLFAAFRTIDAINYSDIATVPVDRCVLDFATEPNDSQIGLVTLDDPDEMLSSARIYEIGRRRPTDDDSDPDDVEESEDEDEDDDDDLDGDPLLGPLLEGDEEDNSDSDDGDLSDDDMESDFDEDDEEFFADLGGMGRMAPVPLQMIVGDGEEDDNSEDEELMDPYSSEDE